VEHSGMKKFGKEDSDKSKKYSIVIKIHLVYFMCLLININT